MGLHERALNIARRHCQKSDVQLLDESVALSQTRLSLGPNGLPGLARRYAFEFTVTGERRYTGFVELHGRALRKIELAPHPFPNQLADEQYQYPPRLY